MHAGTEKHILIQPCATARAHTHTNILTHGPTFQLKLRTMSNEAHTGPWPGLFVMLLQSHEALSPCCQPSNRSHEGAAVTAIFRVHLENVQCLLLLSPSSSCNTSTGLDILLNKNFDRSEGGVDQRTWVQHKVWPLLSLVSSSNLL